MTREKEIDNAKNAFYKRVLEDDCYYDPRDCFEEGAKWADTNLKSSWISVEDDLPCNHKELLNPDNKRDTSCVVAIIHGHIVLSRMYKLYGKWYWENNEPTHWFPIPKLP